VHFERGGLALVTLFNKESFSTGPPCWYDWYCTICSSPSDCNKLSLAHQQANFQCMHSQLFNIICYLFCFLALFVGQRLCIDFSVPVPANFLTTLHSHLDFTCSCCFWSSLSCNFIISKDRASRFHRFLVFIHSLREDACIFLCSHATSSYNY